MRKMYRRRLLSCLVICVGIQIFLGLSYILFERKYYTHSIGKFVLENKLEFQYSVDIHSKRKSNRSRDHRQQLHNHKRHKSHGLSRNDVYINSTDDILNRLIANEDSLFSSSIWTDSESKCNIPYVDEPKGLCRNISWQCNYSPTFTVQDRSKSTLKVYCDGLFRVNFISREESEFPHSNHEHHKDAVYRTYEGPTEINFTSQYADVICSKSVNGKSKEYHNYRTQFKPNKDVEDKQRLLFDKTKVKEPQWQPLSILSISLDSVSRAHFHRSCGLPKTAKFLQQLYYAQFGGTSKGKVTRDYSHQAFLFNRINSIGGVTAMNLTPLYAGIFFSSGDDQIRVKEKRFTKKVDEWIWKYANERGYVTSYGQDNGNGLFGTRTVCKDCTDRPGVLPYWEHGWVKLENKEVSPGVLSGFCVADHMVHDYILNYTRDFLKRDYPAKWIAFDLNAHHRPEEESINQVDDSLVKFLKHILHENKNLVVFLFGDHGDQYHRGKLTLHPGSQLQVLLPFLSIILPRHVLDANPRWRSNLLINSQRYMVGSGDTSGDICPPPLDRPGPPSRECSDAGVPLWSCACRQQTVVTGNWTDVHKNYAQMAADIINTHHSQKPQTSCMDVHIDTITSVIEQTFAYGGRENLVHYHIEFKSQQGPSKWQVQVNPKGSIEYLKQISRYEKYRDCHDERVSIEFCICLQYPPGTP
ncbi:uncharacterized protein LOC117114457 [Anneissia japonica]|uniref:uncharacterized protein LOC117114457 n=1 Tax=Anneissia japonica TaxID=1529436 RepID=UPI001425BB57|nr:uncharacterized protein LOC117114457 [Anneissia japonica]